MDLFLTTCFLDSTQIDFFLIYVFKKDFKSSYLCSIFSFVVTFVNINRSIFNDAFLNSTQIESCFVYVYR